MARIFVSYRHGSAVASTERVIDQIIAEFGEESVFHDIRSIPLGDDFRVRIDNALATCTVLVAVIGEDWEGNGRLHDPEDFVAYEVSQALSRGIAVIPVLVERQQMPRERELPQKLRDLPYRQSLSVRLGYDFHPDTERLLVRLRQVGHELKRPGGLAEIAPTSYRACPIEKKLVRVAIVGNGSAGYVKAISMGFQKKSVELFRATGYDLLFAEHTGDPAYDGDEVNSRVFGSAVAGENGDPPNVLVTIGSGVSEFAKQHYLDRVPLIFLGVADPIRSELVSSLRPSVGRGNIAGTTYGVPVRIRLEFLIEAFPSIRTFGFISNPKYRQDIFVSREVMRLAREELGCSGRFRVITAESGTLTAEQAAMADMFFGFYYLNLHMASFLKSVQKPIVGLNEEDVKRGAIASTGNNDERLGELAARELLYAAIVEGKALSSRPIFQPRSPEFAINLQIARKFGITVPRRTVETATHLIDGVL